MSPLHSSFRGTMVLEYFVLGKVGNNYFGMIVCCEMVNLGTTILVQYCFENVTNEISNQKGLEFPL